MRHAWTENPTDRCWARLGAFLRATGAVAAAATVVSGLSLALVVRSPEAASAATPSPLGVAVFGDSIGHSAEGEVRGSLGATRQVLRYDAVNGTTVAQHQASVNAVVRAATRPDVVVIELGTNDAEHLSAEQFRRDLRTMLATVAPRVSCVRWLDLKPTPTAAYSTYNAHAVGFNRIIAEETAPYANVEPVHYSAWSSLAGPTYFLADLLHLNVAGRQEFGRLVRQAVDGCDPALAVGPFWDVTDGQAVAPAVAWMQADGLTQGFANRTYRAAVASLRPVLTRGQMARFLWRMAGSPTGLPPNSWSDAPVGLDPALDWLAASGVGAAESGPTFRPEVAISRGSAAGMLWRLAGSPSSASVAPWTDATPSLAPALRWVAEHGVMTGYADGTFRPLQPLTRGQAASALFRVHLTMAPPAPAAEPTTESSPVVPVAPPPSTPESPVDTTATTVTEPPTTIVSPSTSTPMVSDQLSDGSAG